MERSKRLCIAVAGFGDQLAQAECPYPESMGRRTIAFPKVSSPWNYDFYRAF